MDTIKNKEQFTSWFFENHNRYHHDLLNDAFYDQIIFNKKENGYFVEIGVLDGWIHSQSIFFEHIRNWNGIVVEPTPHWEESLRKQRFCNICTDAISNTNQSFKFVCNQELAFSHLDTGDDIHQGQPIREIIEVNTITLYDLLEHNNAPFEIDFISIDVEGHELKILTEFFGRNDKYKVNLISLEHHDTQTVDKFFKDKPYVKIKNPYLDFLKIDHSGLGIIRLDTNNFLVNQNGIRYEKSVSELCNINYESYFVHMDYLKTYPHLKNYIN